MTDPPTRASAARTTGTVQYRARTGRRLASMVRCVRHSGTSFIRGLRPAQSTPGVNGPRGQPGWLGVRPVRGPSPRRAPSVSESLASPNRSVVFGSKQQLVLDPGETRPHRAFEEHHLPGLRHLEDRHPVDGGAGRGLGRRIDHVVGAHDERDVGVRELRVDFLESPSATRRARSLPRAARSCGPASGRPPGGSRRPPRRRGPRAPWRVRRRCAGPVRRRARSRGRSPPSAHSRAGRRRPRARRSAPAGRSARSIPPSSRPGRRRT